MQYGAIDDGHADYGKKRGVMHQLKGVGMLALPPFCMFALMVLLYSLLSGCCMPLCLALSATCIFFSIVSFVVQPKSPETQIYYLLLSILMFVATINGIMAGLSIHARFYGPYRNYDRRPVYTNVMATDPAASRSDGGIINFADNAIVDTVRAGYVLSDRGDHRFCVAPILDESQALSQQAKANYWVVGMDCCTGRVSFYCDDAQDPAAKTGAVVFDLDSMLINDPYRQFMRAVKQASARNRLQIPDEPILVRWVKDSATVTDGLWRDGTMSIIGGLIFYGLISMALAFGLHLTKGR